MLATLVIALREGLEATLIVGIIAAFLRRNGAGLGPMWAGVGLAVLLSLGVGLGLNHLEQSLPQARQEALETLIGVVAIVFVTGMIWWMDRHGRDLKSSLEQDAAAALSGRGATALAAMAFLAVLKEGFETAVFFLATFSAAQSALWAGIGALIGLALAIGIGWGIYQGGVRLNLSRFFRITGGFLVLVAAGLCVSALRTGHEAGWINGGQQMVMDLGWLVAPGTVQAALITGVLGIPSDPRLIEVLGWVSYLAIVGALVYWPTAYRPSPRNAGRLKLGAALMLAVAALGLFLVPQPRARLRPQAPVAALRGDGAGQVQLRGDVLALDFGGVPLNLPHSSAQSSDHNGLPLSEADYGATVALNDAPQTVSFAELVALNGGRRPIGLNPTRYPGPYTAQWQADLDAHARLAQGAVVQARGGAQVLVTLSGRGLQTPRSLRVRKLPQAVAAQTGPLAWATSDTFSAKAMAAYRAYGSALQEWQFWARQLSVVLLLAALAIALRAARQLRSLAPERVSPSHGAGVEPAPKGSH
ncbi:iron uptake transporter permease EfeU [Thioclava kandeliae]|uniref:Iron uptake transporter permease EfeU n=1 Tax=Thioclava kandeliae TaxID=3070818 RepID=A0ABV1SIV0_9RHOB